MVLGRSFRGPLVLGSFLKVHGILAEVHPSHGGSSEHLIFRILHPSQARFSNLRLAVVWHDIMQCFLAYLRETWYEK